MYTNLSGVWIGGVEPSVSQTRPKVQTKQRVILGNCRKFGTFCTFKRRWFQNFVG